MVLGCNVCIAKRILRKSYLFIVLCFFTLGHAQDISKQSNIIKNEFKIAPYINYNSTLGFGFGLIPMYSFLMHKNDTVSPRSVIGVLGYYTTNKSKTLITFGNLFFNRDKWRIQYGLGIGIYNFQTYYDPPVGEGIFLNYGTESKVIYTNIRRLLSSNFYLGIGYTYQTSKTDFDIDQPEVNTDLNILQFDIFRDTRDFIFYPKKGSVSLFRLNYIPDWLGNGGTSNVLIMNYNKYINVNKGNDIIALRFHTKAGLQNVKFQQQPVLGGVDLRGYSKGKYRGDGLLDIQGEYRWNFSNKYGFSAVGFLGFGTIYGSDVEDFNWKVYPSIGTGIRYNILKSNHTNIGLDLGVGKEDWGVNFRFGEAF